MQHHDILSSYMMTMKLLILMRVFLTSQNRGGIVGARLINRNIVACQKDSTRSIFWLQLQIKVDFF